MDRQKKFEGIILKSTPLFESDKRVEVFTKTDGKLSFLAKRVHKASSFAGRLEPLNHVTICSFKGKTFFYINHIDVIHFFPNIRADFNKLSMSLFMTEIIKKSTMENQENTQLFNLLKGSLTKLNGNDNIFETYAHFLQSFLVLEGILNISTSPYPSEVNRQYSLQHIQDLTASFSKKFEEYSGRTINMPLFV